MKKTYTALTIGPIYKTLNQARKTRELWAGSFLFSHAIMERIIEELDRVKDDIILPNPEIERNNINKAGLYPDRLIMEGDHENILKDIKSKILEELAEILNNAGCNKEDTQKYLKNYFYINIIKDEVEDGQSVPHEMSRRLAVTELFQKAIPGEDPDCIINFLLNVPKTKLYDNIFGKNRSYPSLIEIATKKLIAKYWPNGKSEEEKVVEAIAKGKQHLKEKWTERLKELKKQSSETPNRENEMKKLEQLLKEIEEDKDAFIDEALIEVLSKEKIFEGKFKQPHKYIAIVQSDGDNVGKLIEEIYKDDPDKISAFSQALSKFALEAAEEIQKYGGETVYAGGDDLLFFAPVLTHESNIFKLVEDLDEIFKKEILANPELESVINNMEDKKPSMSYGIALTYYKFPLNEAREKAYEMLQKAKTGDKNKAAYYWQKHSGQSFSDVLEKKENSFFTKFLDLLQSDVQGKVISSYIHNLNEHDFILKEIIGDQTKLNNYFDNFYDEPEHKTGDAEKFKKTVIALLQHAFKDTGHNAGKAIERTYNALRFVKFLNRKAQEND